VLSERDAGGSEWCMSVEWPDVLLDSYELYLDSLYIIELVIEMMSCELALVVEKSALLFAFCSRHHSPSYE
jgi:hypothetical protein